MLVPAPYRAQGDPCGAGNCFAAATAGALADGALPEEAVQRRVAEAAAFVAAGGAGAGDLWEASPTPPTEARRSVDAFELAASVRAAGGTVVATGGCFDLLHAGHVGLLESARRIGDCLIVCVNSDEYIARLKGPGRPLTPVADRVRVLSGLGSVDAVAVFGETTPEPLLRELRPDLWVKGGDYSVDALPEAAALREWGGQALVLPYFDGHSTLARRPHGPLGGPRSRRGAAPVTGRPRAGATAGRPVAGPGPDTGGRATAGPGAGTGHVLVLRALGLGDRLIALPALRAVRRGLPGRRLVLAAPGRAVPRRLDWSGPPPEVAIDLHGNGPPSHLLLDRLRPGRLWAYAHPDTPHLPGPVWRADEHERDRWCRLMSWYGLPADPADLRLPAPPGPTPAAGAVVLHPGADAAARRWPPERFAAVTAALRARGHRLVITAGAGEGPLAAEVAERAGLPPQAVFGGTADVPFDRLAALAAGARAVVVGDTGLAHLATALGTPSVVLFGPVSPGLWGSPRTARHRVLWHPPPAGGPDGAAADPHRPSDAHGARPDERLLRITPDEVLGAVRALLDTGARGPLVAEPAVS